MESGLSGERLHSKGSGSLKLQIYTCSPGGGTSYVGQYGMLGYTWVIFEKFSVLFRRDGYLFSTKFLYFFLQGGYLF